MNTLPTLLRNASIPYKSILIFYTLLCVSTALFAQNEGGAPNVDETVNLQNVPEQEISETFNRDSLNSGAGIGRELQKFRDAGDSAIRDGFYDIAEKMYSMYWEKAYNQDTLIDSTERLFQTRILQDKLNEARTLLEKVILRNQELYPSKTSEFHQLSAQNRFKIHYMIGQLDFLQKDFEGAIALFSGIIESSSSNPLKSKALLSLAKCQIALKDWSQAKSIFNQLIQSTGEEEILNSAYLGLIEVAISEKDFAQAENFISSNLTNAKGFFRSSLKIMSIFSLLTQGKIMEAYETFRSSFDGQTDFVSHPTYYPILRDLGLSLFKTNEFDEGKRIFERMLPLLNNEEQKKEILLDLAEGAEEIQKKSLAIQYYSRFIELYRDDPLISKVQLIVARLFDDGDNADLALKHYLLVYELEQNEPDLRYLAAQRIGWIYKTQKMDLEKAIKYFFESSTLEVSEDKKASGVFFAAETYFFIEDFNNAAIYYQSVSDSYSKTEYAEEARFRQAQARFMGKRFRMAAEAFELYLESWPKGTFSEDALLNKGIAERNAGDFTRAINTLKSYVLQYANSEKSPRALLEASLSASAADLQHDAIEFLTQIVENYKDSDLYPKGLYQRAYLRLSYGFFAEARKDSFEFLDTFSESHPELAADVYLWLGDHFANHNDFDQAEKLFMEVVRRYEDQEDAPIALYEAAKSAYNLSKIHNTDYDRALQAIDQLFTTYPNAPERIVAQARFLRGDIATIKGDFEDAVKWFKECSELVPLTDLYYAAIGRLGESYYSIATIKENPVADYQAALAQFKIIISGKNVKRSLLEMARYRAGKIYELLNQPGKAKDEYFNIFFEYEGDRKSSPRIRHWYYFARAGFDLARLYTDEGEYTSAKTVYTRLGHSDIPIADDAKIRARELDRIYLDKIK